MEIQHDHLAFALRKPVVFIGMMGSGKTHFGRLLARALNMDFFDSDLVVEEKAGCSIAQIFERWGESKFREVEAITIEEILMRGPCVMAAGGGAVMTPAAADCIFSQSLSIWIEAPLDVVLDRVSKNKTRPLLACEDPRKVLEELMEKRRSTYARADLHVTSGVDSAEHTLEQIIEKIRAYADV